jgi:putative hemolysin
MSSVWLEILFIILLILFNGYLAMSELAIVSARKIRLKQMAENGEKGAETALSLSEKPSHFLSTVQIGITLVGILAGVFGGATIAEELASFIGQVPYLKNYSQPISVFTIVLIITYLTLVLGELTPKQLALTRAEAIAKAVAPFMKRLSQVTSPLVNFLSASTALVLRLLGIKPIDEPTVTAEDIKLLLEQGAEEGVFQPIEEEMMQQVFRLGDQKASELMTPRMDVVFLDIEDPLQKNIERMAKSGFSRYPLVKGGMDHILGIVRSKDLLLQYFKDQSIDFLKAQQAALFVPESSPIIQVIEEFRQKRLHMAIVLDEYGGTQGIVTPTDILEKLVGDLPDLNESYDPDIVVREDGSLLLDGLVLLDDLKEILQVKELPVDLEDGYQTLGGLVMSQLSRIPTTGDTFVWEGLSFEVIDMDGYRVDKVLVKKFPNIT